MSCPNMHCKFYLACLLGPAYTLVHKEPMMLMDRKKSKYWYLGKHLVLAIDET